MRGQPTNQRIARCVQSSGRPSGAPSGLDAATPLHHPLTTNYSPLPEPIFQTPNHNLIPGKTGPAFGVHFTTNNPMAGCSTSWSSV
jgi:hypothetical protein